MDKDNNGDYIFGDSNEESHYIEFMIGHPGVAHFLMRCIDSSIPHFSLLNDPLCDLQVAVSLGLNSKMQLS